ncbi:hypothetical protein [Paenibacillus paeoniae]|uniref:Uncharacterized protein n=1 Tax=Paenibacillus paeoniae TaxID=2292705 RepID=A0A371PFI0_9BACL|nr:hypothetical protein [Paenibacillus paeoniae]REK74248.1 hypothetical protein DX130_17040 [Paenibacillus paeoniae]
MKLKKLAILFTTVIMLLMTSAVASASVPLNRTDTITGQGTLKITGSAYFSGSPAAGVLFASVYRVTGGTEVLVESSRSNIFSNPNVVSYTINFNTNFTQGTYIIRYSHSGSLADLTTYVQFL